MAGSDSTLSPSGTASGEWERKVDDELHSPMIKTSLLRDAFHDASGEIFDIMDGHRRGRIDLEYAAVFFALSIRRDGKMPSREKALRVAQRSLGGPDGKSLAEGLTRPGFLDAYWSKVSAELPETISAREAERRIVMVNAMRDGLAAVIRTSGSEFPTAERISRALDNAYDAVFHALDLRGRGYLTFPQISIFLHLAVFPVLYPSSSPKVSIAREYWEPNTKKQIDLESWRRGCEALRGATAVREVPFMGLCLGVFTPILEADPTDEVHAASTS